LRFTAAGAEDAEEAQSEFEISDLRFEIRIPPRPFRILDIRDGLCIIMQEKCINVA
jgi:hypothetical protein